MPGPSTGGNTYLKALAIPLAAGSASTANEVLQPGAAAGSSNERKQVAHILSVQIEIPVP